MEKVKTRRGRSNKNELKNLTILYQNVRGIKSKLPSIHTIINEIKPTIICYVETHLNEEDNIEKRKSNVEGEEEVNTIEGYEVLRSDRSKKRGRMHDSI